jgi:ketosteroid isomerase-like protein
MHGFVRCTIAASFVCASAIGSASAGPKEELIAADKAFSALSVAKGDSAAFLAFLADDGRLFGTGDGLPLLGKAAAAASFKSGEFRNGPKATLSWEPDYASVSSDGTLGWTDGRWTFAGAPNAKGERVQATGHYLTVWRKEPDGVWKVAADMGTTDPTPKAN